MAGTGSRSTKIMPETNYVCAEIRSKSSGAARVARVPFQFSTVPHSISLFENNSEKFGALIELPLTDPA
jgi:hypothetical protein